MWTAESRTLATSQTKGPAREDLAAWGAIVHSVQPFLDHVALRVSEQVQAFDPEIAVYAQYALTNQGKQLRPALVALTATSVGKIIPDHINAGAIVEMVHLATLVHDDIMDAAEIRRGRPTVAANWGNEISVLLGDCLFAQALLLAASFPTTEICRMVAGSTKDVCTGEILQTKNCYRFDLTRSEYLRILGMKTGVLFALACDLGGLLAGGTPPQRASLREYGMALGTAYQIYDDCLDLYATEKATGKSLGTDLANGKLTLPLLVLLERASAEDRERFRLLFQSFERNALPEVLNLLEKYNALAESQRVVSSHCEEARRLLKPLPANDSREALKKLTVFLTQQTRSLGVVH